jgi:hypothetical protein
MIVHDFNIKHIAALKPEADTPLFIDADAVTALPVALQGFQPIARRHTQKIKCGGGMKLLQFTHGNGGDVHKPQNATTREKRLCIVAFEGSYHGRDNDVSR